MAEDAKLAALWAENDMRLGQGSFLTQEEKPARRHIEVLPVSVVELEAQDSTRRDGRGVGAHDRESSRATFSHFPREIGVLAVELYLHKAMLIFDPFAGWGERAAICEELGRPYLGYDISPRAIHEAEERYGVHNTLADSTKDYIPAFDGLLTCPPYWNLERYSPMGLDAISSWDDFLVNYRVVWKRAYQAAKPGAIFCIYVGDWRHKGRYYDLTYQTQRAFDSMDAEPVDVVIGSRLRVTKIKVLIPQAVRLGYTVKLHETLLVYRKPE